MTPIIEQRTANSEQRTAGILFIVEAFNLVPILLESEYKKLSEYTGIKITFKTHANITKNDINEHDIFIFVRSWDFFSLKLARKIKSLGGLVIVFYDDDLLLLSSQIQKNIFEKLDSKIHAYCIKNILKISDVVLSPNEHLAKKYLSLQNISRYATLTTHIVTQKDINKHKNKNDKIKIVYPTSGHFNHFDLYVRPDMQKICDEFGDKISFTFVGAKPNTSEFSSKIEIHYVNFMPLENYRNFMEKSNFDIGIAPLNNDEFSRCKYWNKYLEYTVSGVAGIYSNVEPYTLAINNGENGLLVENSSGAWYEAIKRLVYDSELRENIITNAQSQVLENFSPEKTTTNLLASIPEIKNFNLKRKHCNSIFIEKIIHNLNNLYAVLYVLRKFGLKFVTQKIMKNLKK